MTVGEEERSEEYFEELAMQVATKRRRLEDLSESDRRKLVELQKGRGESGGRDGGSCWRKGKGSGERIGKMRLVP